jgi:hypothetical protein
MPGVNNYQKQRIIMKFIYLIFPIVVLVTFYLVLCSTLGKLAIKHKIKINYTRKIGHFSMFIFPGGIYKLFNINNYLEQIIIVSISTILFFISLSKLFRDKYRYLNLAFYSIDRPEDRPYTLLWIFTQTFLGFLILAIFAYIWNIYNIPLELMYISILTTTIGDGLAEPIGVRFGKHKYSVKSIFTDRKYFRSYEGSSMVFISALVIYTFHMDYFSHDWYKWSGLILYPVLMTITEARSPHTWDTPFLFFIGNLIISIIYLG